MQYFKLIKNRDLFTIEITENWNMYFSKEILSQVETLKQEAKNFQNIEMDLSNLKGIDTAGAIILYEIKESLSKEGKNVTLLNENDIQKKFVDFIYSSIAKERGKPITVKRLNFIEKTGKYFIGLLQDIWLYVVFVGEVFESFVLYLTHPKRIRWQAIVKGVEKAGVNALPIIALTSFLVGVVVAYQSAVQLQKFGANIFIVDMIGISVTRELAPLITAIVVAGRSGSSYTAQIGAMKITRELDAMKTMGFNLFEFIVLPRIIALMVAMPLMIFFADMVGIFGGMVVSNYQIDISYSEFIRRLQNVLEAKHFWIGISKGPVFALLIAGIGCFRGLQVKNNTESIGRYTTISVVNAIFLVIACDALFSVIFTKLGV